MQPTIPGSHPVLSQIQNNSTLWIGHLDADPTEHFAGQTFICPADSRVNSIQVYFSTVHHEGDVMLSLHEFDSFGKTWGPPIANTSIFFEKGDDARWVRFSFDPVSLNKQAHYGFRLSSGNAMIGIGEAAGAAKHPFNFGSEWSGNSSNQKGHYYSYFSLAFKIEQAV